mgnify:CR=1 FL=1
MYFTAVQEYYQRGKNAENLHVDTRGLSPYYILFGYLDI